MKAFDRLFDIIKTLRSENGCPWDREQTLASLDHLFLEECYEFSDAIHQNNIKEIREELGDAFFMLLLMGYIAEQDGICKFEDVLNDASEKLIFRHPHVFNNHGDISTDEVVMSWEALKKQEKKDRSSIFDGIPASLPDMMRFNKLYRKLKNNQQEISEYKEEILNPKAELKNMLIDLSEKGYNVSKLIREINHEIEQEARNKGL